MNPITKPRDEDEYYDRREKTENELFCPSCGSHLYFCVLLE